MTKIFITIPWFLPAFRAGGPIQSIANLVREYHEGITYFIFCGDTDINGAELENIETNKWTSYNDHTQVWYARPEKTSDTLLKQVETIKPDMIFITGLFSWHYNIVPILFCKGPAKILSARGMLHPGALTQRKWKKRIYLQLFKLLEYHYNVAFHATDEAEAKYITDYFGEPAKVFVAGNFPNKISWLPLPGKEKGHLKLISVTLISPIKNILLVLESLEKCKDIIQYDIYGPVKDENYWDQCKQQIKSLPSNIKVEFHKEVTPEKVKEVLREVHVFILPSKSENFGHAHYEALSAGRPLITGIDTPWTHLRESAAGVNVSLEDTTGIAEAIHFFAQMEEEEFEKWSRSAAAYSEKQVDMDKIKEDYRQMFEMASIS